MSDDAAWLLDLFKMQLEVLKDEMLDDRMRKDRLDKLSYSSWAISETLLAVDEYSEYGYICVSVIREVLNMQYYDYKSYYERNKERHIRYKYASEIIKNLLNLTEGYVND